MQYGKKIIEIGGSQGLLLPLDLCKYLGLELGSEIVIQDDKGKDVVSYTRRTFSSPLERVFATPSEAKKYMRDMFI